MNRPTRAWLFNTLAFVPLLMASATYGQPVVATLEGYARVKDGDGVLFGQVEIRLQGIAAPEDNRQKREPGGQESTAHLAQLVEGAWLVCKLDGTMAGKRPVAVCFIGDQDIGAAQVAAGYARDCPTFSKGRYADLEAKAKAVRDISLIYPLPNYC